MLCRLKKSRIQEVDDIREAKKLETFEKSKRESGPRAVSGQRSRKWKDVRGSESGRFNRLKIEKRLKWSVGLVVLNGF